MIRVPSCFSRLLWLLILGLALSACGSSSSEENTAPVAVAGRLQNAVTGELVYLDGRNSSDAQKNTLTYSWVITSQPANSLAVLVNPLSATPTLTPDVNGSYIITLVVNDGSLSSETSTVAINSRTPGENNAPIANAGVSHSVTTGDQVTLDGSASSDPDNDALSYLWSLSSIPTGSGVRLFDSSTVSPNFTPDIDGVYVIALVVDDGLAISVGTTITITSGDNTIPIADAGNDQLITIGEVANLDGSGSSDSDGDTLTYEWAFASMPAASNVNLPANPAATLSFKPDVVGEFVITLIVNDGKDNSLPNNVTITGTSNHAPVANAGTDQTVVTDASVDLDGRASTDEDGDPLTYSWSFASTPMGSTATFDNSTLVTPSFTPNIDGTYIIELVVSDGVFESLADSVTIISETNTAPTANAGPDQNVITASTVSLDGSNSSDNENDTLTFLWAFLSRPNASSASFNNAALANPTFNADIDGDYVITLIVNDGNVNSISDSVTVSANTAPIADAGVDQNVINGNLTYLDGSSSSDLGGGAVTYLWSISSGPSGYTAALSSTTAATTTLTTGLAGTYVISLVVNDGQLNSLENTVSLTSVAVSPYGIVDTNQVICYNASGSVVGCAGSGHDADVNGTQPSYTASTVNNESVITDNVTGLIWQQSTDTNNDGAINYADKKSQSEAVSYCNALDYGGRLDWRLPDIKQLYSLILFSGKDASSYLGSDTSTLTLFIDSNFDKAFGDTTTTAGINAGDRIIDGQYATSTLYVSTTMSNDATMFGVNFVDGRIKGYPTQLTKEFYVRCVSGHSTYGSNNFSDNANSTISDSATGLMWWQDDSEPANWDAALAACDSDTTATHTDWRLPNAKELQSIVDYTRSPDTDNDAAINALFNSTSFNNEENILDWGYYWASTTHVDNDSTGKSGVYVSFGRALGYINPDILDVHGAGSQRSNDKQDVTGESSATDANALFYYKGPQGDILRVNNKVRCVRDI